MNDAWVVDASVAAQWLFPEPQSDAAWDLLLHSTELHAPALLHAEIGNVVCKRRRRGEIDDDYAKTALEHFASIRIATAEHAPLLKSTIALATALDRSFYDSLYLALAIEVGLPLVTADRRFFNALAATPIAPYLCWIDDVPRAAV